MTSPTGSTLDECHVFLAAHPDIEAIDIILTDAHGIGRGKIIRRHELEALYTSGRSMPVSIFGMDVCGEDVEATGLVLTDGDADRKCWPIPGTLGAQPHTEPRRAQVLITMMDHDGTPFSADPRVALARQIEKAEALGYQPMGAFEVEFYLIDRDPAPDGRKQLVHYPLSGRRSEGYNTYTIDELDEMSPLFSDIYEGAKALNLPLETLISEYAPGQFEFTLRYGNLMQAADHLIMTKRLIRSVARRHKAEACFMAKPFGHTAGSGMHLHLSLADKAGINLFADDGSGPFSPLMLHSIAGIQSTLAETMVVLAPFANSWRRFASTIYSPVSTSWGVNNRTVALRVPNTSPKARHFEHRVAGVDANPYLVAAVTLGGALKGIAEKADPGLPVTGNGYEGHGQASSGLPRDWLSAIELCDASAFMKQVFGPMLHQGFVAMKKAEYMRIASEVSDVEWRIYGPVV
jgi:glutamine synthetase